MMVFTTENHPVKCSAAVDAKIMVGTLSIPIKTLGKYSFWNSYFKNITAIHTLFVFAHSGIVEGCVGGHDHIFGRDAPCGYFDCDTSLDA